MRRREYVAYIIGAAATLPTTTRAQQPGRLYRLGIVTYTPRATIAIAAAFEGLQSMGFAEGKNLAIDGHSFNLRADQMETAAGKMAEAKVDALVATSGGVSIRACQAATTAIPIIGIADDMVREGVVGSLANRGSNTTGMSILAAELDGKRQELLMEMLPAARRMALLVDGEVKFPAALRAVEQAMRAKGVEPLVHTVEKPEQIAAALDSARAENAQAINVLASPLLQSNRLTIFAKARAFGLPTIFQWPEGVPDGALMAYGPSQVDTFQQLGRLAGKVLRGTKPGDLPVEQPTSFKLSVNLKLAHEMGIGVPASILQRADEVVE